MARKPDPKSAASGRKKGDLSADPSGRPRNASGAGKKSGAKDAAPRKRKPWVVALRWTAMVGIWGFVALMGILAYYGYDLPDLEKLETPQRRPSVTLMASDNSVLANYGDLHGGAVQFDEVPPYLVQAIVATEDRRFFDHAGVDGIGIIRAAFANLRAGAIRQGGSTLTQQLAKNLFLTPERSLKRKVQELLLAFWLEARFSKKQIFTIYLNRVYFGAGTYGIAAASHHYFDRPARALSLRQAAVIAGLLKAPSRYAPLRNPKGAAKRADQVLANMVAAEFLDPRDAKAARGDSLRLSTRQAGSGARYFSDWLLERAAAEGATSILDPFAGSGTTLAAARDAGVRCIGIEREPKYQTIIEARLKPTKPTKKPTKKPLHKPKLRPFLKWVGGKAEKIDEILGFMPGALPHGTVYYEPFLGGGSMFFALRARGFTGKAV
ncbi:MAG: hypothetical protein HOK82_21805, partial [Rhodospirillaceae bacterium]|nr:hypothetical protein [Rhodospirillaceae bacterium]